MQKIFNEFHISFVIKWQEARNSLPLQCVSQFFFSFVRHASKHFQKASYWRHGQPASTTQSFNLFLNLFEQPIIRAKHALCHMQEINVKQETGAGNIDSIQDRFYIFDYSYSTVLINFSSTQLQLRSKLCYPMGRQEEEETPSNG